MASPLSTCTVTRRQVPSFLMFFAAAQEVRRLVEDREDPTLEDRWRVAQMFGGSRDGRRVLSHACLVRNLLTPAAPRGMWVAAGRSILESIAEAPVFSAQQIVAQPGESIADATVAAQWEVVHACLSALQEVGWHTAIEALKYPISTLGDDAAIEDFDRFCAALSTHREAFLDALIAWNLEQDILGPATGRHEASARFRGLSDTKSRIGSPARLRKVVH